MGRWKRKAKLHFSAFPSFPARIAYALRSLIFKETNGNMSVPDVPEGTVDAAKLNISAMTDKKIGFCLGTRF